MVLEYGLDEQLPNSLTAFVIEKGTTGAVPKRRNIKLR
jgi:hypothetical protein